MISRPRPRGKASHISACQSAMVQKWKGERVRKALTQRARRPEPACPPRRASGGQARRAQRAFQRRPTLTNRGSGTHASSQLKQKESNTMDERQNFAHSRACSFEVAPNPELLSSEPPNDGGLRHSRP